LDEANLLKVGHMIEQNSPKIPYPELA
jgi:hypothetical protein